MMEKRGKYRTYTGWAGSGVPLLIDLDQIQKEIDVWQRKNFGEGPSVHPLLGMVEEVGELAHAVLKDEQGIRGTHEEHEEAAIDAIGDLMIYTMAYCTKRGWALSDIIEETWLHVQKRDWTRNSYSGEAANDPNGEVTLS